MNKYEIMCVFDAQAEGFQSGLSDVKKQFEENKIEITKEDDIGVKTLAYEMDSHTHAHYVCFSVQALPNSADKVHGDCKLIKPLLRMLVVKK